MTASSQKETKCIFRIEEDLLKKYKSICEKNGYDMSKRLRLFIEKEIQDNPVYKEINVKQIFYKPTIDGKSINIFGKEYLQIINGAKVFVVETDDIIEDNSNLIFRYGNIIFRLNRAISEIFEGKTFIECRNWKEDY